MPNYVWVVQSYLGSDSLFIERYELIKLNPKGGASVNCRGGVKHVKAASGRKFFTDEQQFWLYVRNYVANNITRAQRAVTRNEEIFKRLAAGDQAAVDIAVIPPEQPVPKKLKLE